MPESDSRVIDPSSGERNEFFNIHPATEVISRIKEETPAIVVDALSVTSYMVLF